ncbi:MAG TPA: hypothetical protein VET87_16650 [Rubrivivax sp.]|nr:hypothetical protein [Rubrivivax sp.]
MATPLTASGRKGLKRTSAMSASAKGSFAPKHVARQWATFLMIDRELVQDPSFLRRTRWLRQVLVNRHAKDMQRSRAIFKALGPSFDPPFTYEQGAWHDQVVLIEIQASRNAALSDATRARAPNEP